MAWLILAIVVLIVVVLLAVAALQVAALVITLRLWKRGREIGCGFAPGDVWLAYLRGRGGVGIERVRQQLWVKGHTPSFHEVERMAASNRLLRSHIATTFAIDEIKA